MNSVIENRSIHCFWGKSKNILCRSTEYQYFPMKTLTPQCVCKVFSIGIETGISVSVVTEADILYCYHETLCQKYFCPIVNLFFCSCSKLIEILSDKES